MKQDGVINGAVANTNLVNNTSIEHRKTSDFCGFARLLLLLMFSAFSTLATGS
jgi:hypothetical protein